MGKLIIENIETGSVSDGFHTFDELYEHRFTLWIALCRILSNDEHVWRSRLHSDGSAFEGWFVLGFRQVKGKQITYHLPESRWEETDFAHTLDRAPEFDGHTPTDILERLRRL